MTDLAGLLAPSSIAIIGASATAGAPGRDVYENIAHHSKFDGELFLVNPARAEIDGRRCYRAISELPANSIDVAVVVVGVQDVVSSVEQCAERGVRFAIIPTGGMGELGSAGKLAEARLREVVAESGIRLYGPNCPGLSNVNDGIFMSVSPSARSDTLGGSIGLVTQGGALGRNAMQYMDQGLGIGCWLSAGNEVDLELSEFVAHLVADPRIAVIACVIEGFQDGSGFLRAVLEAGAVGKPVVAVVLGQSDVGARAAESHTAHLAGSGRVAEAVLRQHGVVVVPDVTELMEQSALLARRTGGQIRPCVVSFSGGAAVGAVDALAGEGLELAELGPRTLSQLTAVLPSFATAANPLDLTMEVFRRTEIARDSAAILGRDPGVNTLVVPVPADYGEITRTFAREVMGFESEAAGNRVVPVWTSPRRGGGNEEFERHGAMPFSRMSGLARALRRCQEYERWRARPATRRSRTDSAEPPSERGRAAPRRDIGELTEVAAKALLAEYQVPVPAGELAESPRAAAQVAERIGFPVVMKVASAAIAHKTDVGAVATDVGSVAAVHDQWTALMAASGDAGIRTGDIAGLLVEQQAAVGVDLLVAVRRDPTFGRIVALGLGGVFTEVLNDVTFAVPPMAADELRALLADLAGWPLLEGARGRPPADLDALAEVVTRLDELISQHPDITEVEINPLRLYPVGEGAVALDALITARDPVAG